jgi:16S rRNA (guanine527-N7)-methyltransferase
MPTPVERFETAVRAHAPEFGVKLGEDTVARLGQYFDLVMKWNPRLHLVAPCSPEEFATRHALESLMLLPHVPESVRVIDVGSGAGLPAIPCLIARPDIHATLIDSSRRKAIFLTEALRNLQLATGAEVFAARFQDVTLPAAEVVTSRALDRFEEVLVELIKWTPPGATLALFGGERLVRELERLLPHSRAELLPESQRRFLIIASSSVTQP